MARASFSGTSPPARNWRDGKELHDTGHRDAVASLTFTPDGKRLISQGMDYTIRLWDLSAGKEMRRFDSHEGGDRGRAQFSIFHPLDNDSLLRRVANGVGILDLKTGKERSLANPPQGAPAAISADGKRLVTYELRGSWSERTASVTYTLWDLTKGEKIREFTHTFKAPPPRADAGAWPAAVAIAPDGNTLATSWLYLRHGPMYTIRVGHGVSLWDVATGKERPIETSAALNLTFLDGGKTLVCADGQGRLREDGGPKKDGMEFWDVAGKRLRALPRPADDGGALVFSPDGRLFASAGGYEDPTVYLWRTTTGELVKRLVGHTREVQYLTFSPDGRLLATGSRDTTVLLWEVPGLR